MACKTETKEINDKEFSVTQWPAEKALNMQFKLAKLFGSGLASLSAVIESKDESDTKELEAIGTALQEIFKNNEPEDVTKLIKDCVVGTACDGKLITESKFEELFSGDDLFSVYRVFFFVLQVNYSGLLKSPLIEGLVNKVKQ